MLSTQEIKISKVERNFWSKKKKNQLIHSKYQSVPEILNCIPFKSRFLLQGNKCRISKALTPCVTDLLAKYAQISSPPYTVEPAKNLIATCQRKKIKIPDSWKIKFRNFSGPFLKTSLPVYPRKIAERFRKSAKIVSPEIRFFAGFTVVKRYPKTSSPI